MIRGCLLFLFVLLASAPAHAFEYLPDNLAEVQWTTRFEDTNFSNRLISGLGFHLQWKQTIFFGARFADSVGTPKPIFQCPPVDYRRSWSGGTGWIGASFTGFRLGARYTRSVESIVQHECMGYDVSGDSTVDINESSELHRNTTEHLGAMLEYRLAPSVWAGVLYDHHFQVAAWAAFGFPRLLFTLDAERFSIPHDPFPRHVRTGARLGLRFSPTGAVLTKSRFHIMTSVGFVHTDFEAVDGWSPDQPTALLVVVSLAGLWR